MTADALRAAPTLRDALQELVEAHTDLQARSWPGGAAQYEQQRDRLRKAWESARAALAHPPEGAQTAACDHRWAPAQNPRVPGSLFCVRCTLMTEPADSTAQGPACTQQPRTAVAPVAVDSTERSGKEPATAATPSPLLDALAAAPESALAHPPEVELPDEGELEAWRSTADELLRTNQPHAPTLRRAAHLLQNAYLFASKLTAHPPEGAQTEPAATPVELPPLLQRFVDSIEIVDGVACYDYMLMYDLRDALYAGALHAPSAS